MRPDFALMGAHNGTNPFVQRGSSLPLPEAAEAHPFQRRPGAWRHPQAGTPLPQG